MSLLDHTVLWFKGEIFEGLMIALSGVFCVLLAVIFFRWGTTPGAKAMLIPLLCCGALFTLVGGGMSYSNQQKIPQFEQQYQADPVAFANSEKTRVESFQALYQMTLWLAPGCFVLAVGLHAFSLNPHLRAVGLALAVIGFAGLSIDFFSKERADAYYLAIQAHIESKS